MVFILKYIAFILKCNQINLSWYLAEKWNHWMGCFDGTKKPWATNYLDAEKTSPVVIFLHIWAFQNSEREQ